MKMDTPSENSILWGGIVFAALAHNVLVGTTIWVGYLGSVWGRFNSNCFSFMQIKAKELLKRLL